MKRFCSAMLLLLPFTTAPSFAATPQTVGAWTVYSSANPTHSGVQTLLQLRSEGRQTDSDGQPVGAVIDAICSQGKLAAIAVGTTSPIARKSIDQNGDVDTTRISFNLGGNPTQSESWAVLDHGKTIAPYSQILRGRQTREWAARLVATNMLSLQFRSQADPESVTITFQTGGFAAALATAGCTF